MDLRESFLFPVIRVKNSAINDGLLLEMKGQQRENPVKYKKKVMQGTVHDVQQKSPTRSTRQGIFSSFLPSDLTILIHTPRTGRLYCSRTYSKYCTGISLKLRI